ncbi:VQ motif-containing protein 10-like [Durio zibethinus]|uniref:VQ motif-containing protein 10-like n=1 Tax=Durio zibethinus TaxID=66656 RepID=A0A6P5Y4G7_DURZI|nr:VQ motif-containing protein 10-like [Durio zibethinus]
MARGREPMKVVIINTKYVETDAASFKSVVQELTGKDSGVMSNSSKPKSRFYHEQMNKKEEGIPPEAGSSTSGDSVLMKNLSFMEFERLLKEMPPGDNFLWNVE